MARYMWVEHEAKVLSHEDFWRESQTFRRKVEPLLETGWRLPDSPGPGVPTARADGAIVTWTVTLEKSPELEARP